MVPQPAPKAPTTTIVPPLGRSHTVPPELISGRVKGRSLLAPEDAIWAVSPPRKQSNAVNRLQKEARLLNGDARARRVPKNGKERRPSGSRRGSRATWKKLLWVKQSYPDNYTDQDTFLEHLQRNPRLQPYDFWPLVADSTVIVQHVCSVIVFVVCFIGIFQERVSPVAVVGWGSFATLIGWVLWDLWVGQEEEAPRLPIPPRASISDATPTNGTSISAMSSAINLTSHSSTPLVRPHHTHSVSTSSLHSTASTAPAPRIPFNPTQTTSQFSYRTSLRLSTAKSALLIYFTLLGLSPILKSLTRSTSSDSIWAMSFLLFTINIFFFDYATPSPPPNTAVNSFPLGAVGGNQKGNKNIPASLSTNAALMASTVLASRLPSTGQVFSLTLFSIEVFGLFPVFRRYARTRSWRGHVILTALLVAGAGGGVGLVVGEAEAPRWNWGNGLVGVVVGGLVTGLAMGGCSWWLIGLQKYKNEIHGPWDPARPIIRRTY